MRSNSWRLSADLPRHRPLATLASPPGRPVSRHQLSTHTAPMMMSGGRSCKSDRPRVLTYGGDSSNRSRLRRTRRRSSSRRHRRTRRTRHTRHSSHHSGRHGRSSSSRSSRSRRRSRRHGSRRDGRRISHSHPPAARPAARGAAARLPPRLERSTAPAWSVTRICSSLSPCLRVCTRSRRARSTARARPSPLAGRTRLSGPNPTSLLHGSMRRSRCKPARPRPVPQEALEGRHFIRREGQPTRTSSSRA